MIPLTIDSQHNANHSRFTFQCHANNLYIQNQAKGRIDSQIFFFWIQYSHYFFLLSTISKYTFILNGIELNIFIFTSTHTQSIKVFFLT